MAQQLPGPIISDPWVGTRRQYDPTIATSLDDQIMLGRLELLMNSANNIVNQLSSAELDRNDYVVRDIIGRLTNMAGILSVRMRAKSPPS